MLVLFILHEALRLAAWRQLHHIKFAMALPQMPSLLPNTQSQRLGRADNLGDFVRRNCSETWTEITLSGGDRGQDVVIRRCVVQQLSRTWYCRRQAQTLGPGTVAEKSLHIRTWCRHIKAYTSGSGTITQKHTYQDLVLSQKSIHMPGRKMLKSHETHK